MYIQCDYADFDSLRKLKLKVMLFKQFIKYTVELQWLQHLWDHKMLETGVVQANEC